MINVEITKGSDFYHVEVDGKPWYPCATEAEAWDIALALPGDFIQGPVLETARNGKDVHIRTCYERIGGKWEGFVSMVEMA